MTASCLSVRSVTLHTESGNRLLCDGSVERRLNENASWIWNGGDWRMRRERRRRSGKQRRKFDESRLPVLNKLPGTAPENSAKLRSG